VVFFYRPLLGAHVSEYMEKLMDEDNAKYQVLFSDYIKAGVEPDGMEELYGKVHEAIREDPSDADKSGWAPEDRETFKKAAKLTYDERKAKQTEKKAKMEAADEEEEDDEEEDE